MWHVIYVFPMEEYFVRFLALLRIPEWISSDFSSPTAIASGSACSVLEAVVPGHGTMDLLFLIRILVPLKVVQLVRPLL